MRTMTYPELLQVRLPAGLATAIQQTAQREERTASEVVRNALRSHLRLNADGTSTEGKAR